ncbi:QSPP protein, partial [Pseudoatta argentina]
TMSQEKQDIDTMRYIAAKSQNVSINMRKINDLATEVIAYMSRNHNNENIYAVTRSYVRLSSEFHPEKDDKRTADWLFVLNTLNFSLWSLKDMPEWTVNGFTGYMALCAAIKRAIDNGKPMWDPKFYTTLSIVEMIQIFQGDNNISMPRTSQRLTILHEVGKVLLDDYDGTFANCIKSCEHDAIKLMVTIHDKFPSYDDVVIYHDRSVRLFTKAWTLVTDIWNYFDDEEDELRIDIERMKHSTIFVDYRVVQIFNHFNVLVYSKKFLDELKKEEFIFHGTKEEIEIRCCSLMIVRYLHQMLMKTLEQDTFVKQIPVLKLPDFDCTCLIDNFLWDYLQLHNKQLKKNVLCKIYTESY